MSRLFGRRRLTFSIYLIMNMKLTHLLFTLIAFLVMTSGKAQKASADIPYRFATRAEAQMLITDIDAYTNGWNQFDLNVRLQTQNGRKSQLLKLAMESTDMPAEVLTERDTNAVLDSLYACPHGVFSMSYRMPGMVETSTNLAAVKFVEGNTVLITTSQRSDVDSEKMNIAQMVASA